MPPFHHNDNEADPAANSDHILPEPKSSSNPKPNSEDVVKSLQELSPTELVSKFKQCMPFLENLFLGKVRIHIILATSCIAKIYWCMCMQTAGNISANVNKGPHANQSKYISIHYFMLWSSPKNICRHSSRQKQCNIVPQNYPVQECH